MRTRPRARRTAEAALTPDDPSPYRPLGDDQETEVVALPTDRPSTGARARVAVAAVVRLLSTAAARARQIPAALLLALPFSLVAGLLAGAMIPTVAARAAQFTGSDEQPVHQVQPIAASTIAAEDAARPERPNRKKDKKSQPAPVSTVVDDDVLGAPEDAGAADGAATAAGSVDRRGKRSFDPADPSLIYRFPTVTGQTVSPPAGVTRKIALTLPLPDDSGKGRRIVYSASQQHLWVVAASGAVLRDYPVTGRVDRPGPGAYRVYSMSRVSYNPVAAVSFTHMIRFAHGVTGAAIGFNSIPRWENGAPLQTEESLGLALGRGGCIRQTVDNAKFLYRWAHLGDRVVVVA